MKTFKSDRNTTTKNIYIIFLAFILILTIWVCVVSPSQPHFNKIDNNDVWFGDDWHYESDGATVSSYFENYLRLKVTDGHVIITKTIDYTPDDDEYMCFRAKAQDVTVYVNGEVFYSRHYVERYRSYSKTMYLLHQFSVEGIEKGDIITIDLSSVEDFTSLHFVSIGDRFSIVYYILWKSRNSFFICAIALFMMLITMITSYSPIFIEEKKRDIISLKWIASFLGCAVIYMFAGSGAMELFIDKNSVVSWLSNISFMMLPIPFIMFTRDTFFPEHKRYSVLATINLITIIWCIIAYTVFKVSFSDYYFVIHLIVAAGMVMCVISFIQKKKLPPIDVLLGYVIVIGSAAFSIICYWKAIVYPPSLAFGYGLVIFCICMLCWLVRNRHAINKTNEEAIKESMRREKQEAQEANEQKSRFLSHMSHEIRTPLNAILGMNELVMNKTDSEEIRNYCVNIQSAGKTLLALINDVLDTSKIENGKMEIVESEYSLSSLLNDVVLLTQKRATDKSLEYRINIESIMPDVLKGDEVRIRQVMVNLVNNAVKYTNQGYVELAVYTDSENTYLDEDSLTLIIKVSDSGIGIKDEDMSKLFTEFERLDRNKNINVEGSGLGLSISSHLVSLMNGTISVESEYGKGSVFTVKLPQEVAERNPIGDYKKRFEILTNEKEKKEIETLESLKFPNKRVYVVDDNEMNLEVIASILELMEIEVNRVLDGVEAIKQLDTTKYDLILTDDMMPDVDGTKLMQYLHGNPESANNKTPIVVLTANAVVGARQEYISRGFDEYLTKPIDIDLLQKILINYLK
jgi:signal transduction histidine kinase/ActR/RegA family two-component response regulator